MILLLMSMDPVWCANNTMCHNKELIGFFGSWMMKGPCHTHFVLYILTWRVKNSVINIVLNHRKFDYWKVFFWGCSTHFMLFWSYQNLYFQSSVQLTKHDCGAECICLVASSCVQPSVSLGTYTLEWKRYLYLYDNLFCFLFVEF